MAEETPEEKRLREALRAEAMRRAAKTQRDALQKIRARTKKKG